MSQQPHEDAIDQGINKYMVKIQGLIIPVLLTIIGFFVVQSYFSLNQIMVDNQRFNVYIGKNDLRMDNLEDGLKAVQSEQKKLREDHLSAVQKEADDWSDFWKDYGFFFNVNGRRQPKPSH